MRTALYVVGVLFVLHGLAALLMSWTTDAPEYANYVSGYRAGQFAKILLGAGICLFAHRRYGRQDA